MEPTSYLPNLPARNAQGWSTPSWGASGGLGYNPQIPMPTATQAPAVAANTLALPGIEGMAGGINRFNQQQAQQNLIAGLPNYQQLLAQSSGNIGQDLKGQVNSDVIRQLWQGGAERGIRVGGGANTNAAYLAALGLTSKGLQTQGEQELSAAIGRTPQPAPFNFSQFLVTPAEQQSAASANALYAAAPNPTAVAQANLGAANAGLSRGGGSISTPGMVNPYAGGGFMVGQGGGGGYPQVTQGTRTYSGGQYYPEGTSPNTAQANWDSWYQSLYPQTKTATGAAPDLIGLGGYGQTGSGDSPLDWMFQDSSQVIDPYYNEGM